MNGTAVVTVTQGSTIAPRLTTSFSPDPVVATANGCPNFLPTWRYAIILTEINSGTFNVASWAQTITATGGAPSTTNFTVKDFVSLFGTDRVGPKSSVGAKQGLCPVDFRSGTISYTLFGTDSSGNRVSYTTPGPGCSHYHRRSSALNGDRNLRRVSFFFHASATSGFVGNRFVDLFGTPATRATEFVGNHRQDAARSKRGAPPHS